MKRIACFFLLTCLSLSIFASGIDHRKTYLDITVTDAANNPVPNAEVTIRMRNHAFRWGTAVTPFEIINDDFQPSTDAGVAYDPQMAEAVQNFFNSVTFGNEMKWSYFEQYQDRYPGLDVSRQMVQYAQALSAFGGNEPFRVRGHTTVWGSSYQLPADVRSSSDAEFVRNRVEAHIEAYHEYFAGTVTDFDLLNEPFNETTLIDKLYVPEMTEERIDEWANWFRIAHEKDPNAKLWINEYNVLNDWNGDLRRIHQYKALIDALRDRGAPIHGIGLQAHVDRYLSQQSVRKRLDILAAPMAPTANFPQGLPGLPIEITELDIGENNAQGNQWYGRCDSPDDNLQAEMIENILVAAFEHPSVQGLTVWGLLDEKHWRGNGVFYGTNYAPKPALEIWMEYVMGLWWTNETVRTDATGRVIAHVIKGDYDVTATHPDNVQVSQTTSTSVAQNTLISIQLP